MLAEEGESLQLWEYLSLELLYMDSVTFLLLHLPQKTWAHFLTSFWKALMLSITKNIKTTKSYKVLIQNSTKL